MSAATENARRPLVLYDGLCGLCDSTVQWLLRHDRKRVLRFAALQGETARPYLDAARDGGELGTLVLIDRDDRGGDEVLVRSRAVFRIFQRLGAPWSLFAALRVLPTALTDAGYRFVSRRRTRWFGRRDACRIPDAATRARFLP